MEKTFQTLLKQYLNKANVVLLIYFKAVSEYSTGPEMSDTELNETFDLDDKRAEIVPALQKSKHGNLSKIIFHQFHSVISACRF